MSASYRKPTKPAAHRSGAAGNLAQALADLQKAVRGASFYPQGHPYRTETLQLAFEEFQRVVALRPLLLAVNRRGFMVNGDRVEGSEPSLQLAHDCVSRRISSIVFLQGLLLYDLDALVRLLAADPHNSEATGPLLEAGGRTIWINERDVAAVLARRAGGEPAGGEGGVPSAADGARAAAMQIAAREGEGTAGEALGTSEGRTAATLMKLMAFETLDVRYQELGQELLARLRSGEERNAVLSCLEELLRQHRDARRSLPQREFAAFAFAQLVDAMADYLLGSLERKGCKDKERIHRVLAVLGTRGAYLVIERIANAKGLFERRSLAAALIGMGEVAVEPLLAMLKDPRWFVVRNMVSVIGELGNRDCVAGLGLAIYHKDDRVRKEVIRALTKVGGEEAEILLTTLLEEQDEVLVRRAVSALGQMRSRAAVPALLRLLLRRDVMVKELPVKKEVLAALATIGDFAATVPLLGILESRLPNWGRWLELKKAVATTLGVLGDEATFPNLARLANRGGPLGEACREALAAAQNVWDING